MDRVLLSTHMKDYWETIGYKPPTTKMDEADLDENTEEITAITFNDVKHQSVATNFDYDSNEIAKYSGIVVKGFAKEKSGQDIIQELVKLGLPVEYSEDDIKVKEGHKSNTIYIHELKAENCVTKTSMVYLKTVTI